MDMGIQLVISTGIAILIYIPLSIYYYKKFKRENKSRKHLEIKLILALSPIVAVPIIISRELPFFAKLIIIILGILAGIIYIYSLSIARKNLRRVIGLPPEDEHTGEVKKVDDRKEK